MHELFSNKFIVMEGDSSYHDIRNEFTSLCDDKQFYYIDGISLTVSTILKFT